MVGHLFHISHVAHVSLKPVVDRVHINSYSIRWFFMGFVFYCPMSSIGIVLAVEVGLRDGLDWISVLIMNPS